MNVAYIMSRFPKLTETFVLYEMAAAEQAGAKVSVYPLRRVKGGVMHEAAAAWCARARFHPFLSLAIVGANADFLLRSPRRYLGALWRALAGNATSPRFLAAAAVFFPKAVRFAWEMRREGVNHVHAHFATHPALAALIVHRLTDIPYSFTAHGSDLHVDRTMLAEKIAHSAFVVTVSEYNRRLIEAELGPEASSRVHVIHCGVDRGVFTEAAGERGKGSECRIVSVGSLVPVKGHSVLLEATRQLKDWGVAFRCEIIGDGPLRGFLRSRIEELGLGTEVVLRGPQPREEVVRSLARSDVAVLASHPTPDGRREGIPVALMEAMASGLPVVSSDLSGIPELVTPEAGILVPPDDPEGLASAIRRLAESPGLRRSMGATGKRIVADSFDLTDNARRLCELMARASEPRPAGGWRSPGPRVPRAEDQGPDDATLVGVRP